MRAERARAKDLACVQIVYAPRYSYNTSQRSFFARDGSAEAAGDSDLAEAETGTATGGDSMVLPA